jgi:aryl-alcohol dehydrogenase-like predicted oxidoreductase
MTFGEEWGWGAPPEEARRVFEVFAGRGGNFIDTANRYTEGTSETLVGEFVASDRGRFVVGSKYTLSTRPDDPNASGNQRKNIVQALEASLRRMKLDYLDLYWVHAWDGVTPIEEVLRAFDDLVRAGKILYAGISDAPAWVVARANAIADLRGWTPFAGLQIEFSLIQRSAERELLPMARALGIGVTPWAPLGGGLLSGKYKDGRLPSDSKRRTVMDKRLSERNLAIATAILKIAGELRRPASQVALNWVRQKCPGAVPIVGARTVAQMEENLGCLEFELPEEEMLRLDEASAIELGFPHDFLRSESMRKLVSGETELEE